MLKLTTIHNGWTWIFLGVKIQFPVQTSNQHVFVSLNNSLPDAYPDIYQYLEPDPIMNDRDSFLQFIFHSFDSGKACETAVQLHSFTEMSS